MAGREIFFASFVADNGDQVEIDSDCARTSSRTFVQMILFVLATRQPAGWGRGLWVAKLHGNLPHRVRKQSQFRTLWQEVQLGTATYMSHCPSLSSCCIATRQHKPRRTLPRTPFGVPRRTK